MIKNIVKKIISIILDFIYIIIKPFRFNKKLDRDKAEKIIENVYQRKPLNKEKYEYLANEVDLSIVVPVYNVEEYLDQCLTSLINQNTSYKYEIIAINDGSTDNSSVILKKYSKKIKIINQQNQGLSGARNSGMKVANGEYIGFVDSDDYVSNDYVETLLKVAKEKNVDMIKCNYYVFNNDGMIESSNMKCFYTTNKYDKEVLNIPGFVWNGIFKRSLWKDTFFPIGYNYEDMITKLVILNRITSFEQIENKLYYYRKNTASLSRNKKNYKNYKCIDQLFLPYELIKTYAADINKYNFNNLLFEYGPMLFFRTRYLSKEIKKAIFVIACEYINTFKIDVTNSDYKKLLYSFKNKKFILWKLISIKMYLNK